MDFSLVKLKQPHKMKRLSKNKITFIKREEDVSLFHFNELDNELFHAVFNLQDEYKVGTKKLGVQHNYIYSSLINLFFSLKSQYAFLEYINNQYQSEIIDLIESKTGAPIEVVNINNDLFKHIYNEFQVSIKKINLSTEEGELIDFDYVDQNKFYELLNDYTVDDLTFLYENQFVTITRKGRISVNNSDENYVYNFTKRIIDAMD